MIILIHSSIIQVDGAPNRHILIENFIFHFMQYFSYRSNEKAIVIWLIQKFYAFKN